MSASLAYAAAGLVGLWGVAHVLPTARVVAGFNDTSRDNRLVITKEWIAEAVTMWFVAAVVVLATSIGTSQHAVTFWIYRAAAITLLGIATLTTFTGSRTSVVFFKICPVLLSLAAGLLLVASWV